MLRATWLEDTVTSQGLLDLLATSPPWFSDDELDAVEAARGSDTPPKDKWAGH